VNPAEDTVTPKELESIVKCKLLRNNVELDPKGGLKHLIVIKIVSNGQDVIKVDQN